MNLLKKIILLLLNKLYIKTVHISWHLHIESLFTNIPLEETINICTNLLYSNEDVIKGINTSEFKNLLPLATQKSYFIFDDVFYKQKDDVAIGLPLESTMANFFLPFYEVN